MSIKKILLTAAAAAILAATGAAAADWDRDRDHGPHQQMMMRHDDRDGYMDRRGHDRYWHQGYRGYVGHDMVFRGLRAHGYHRWAGEPYWFHGRYVVRTYDRFGHVVFVEVDPYTGAFLGIIRFENGLTT